MQKVLTVSQAAQFCWFIFYSMTTVECQVVQVPILSLLTVQVLERLRSQIFDESENERNKRDKVQREESQKTRMRRILKKFISDTLQK